MALDAEDRARLRRIESGLNRDDPGLVQQFRAWRPSSGRRPLLPGWSPVPGWALLAFLVAAFSWIVTPGLGVLVITVVGIGVAYRRAAHRIDAPHDRGPGGRPGRRAGAA